MSQESATRLSRQQIISVLDPGEKHNQYTCPKCGHGHLELFGDDDVKCWNGCDSKDVIAKIRERLHLDYKPTVKRPESVSSKDEKEPAGSITLIDYAMERHLDVEYLKHWYAARDAGTHPAYSKVTAHIVFPSPDHKGEGADDHYHLRFASGVKRTFGKPQHLYGGRHFQILERMAENGEGVESIFLVEGQSNAQTMSYAGFPTLGLPGVRNWQPDWAQFKCFQQAKRIYIQLDMKDDGKPEAVAIEGALKVADCFPNGKVLGVKLPMKAASDLWMFHMGDEFGGRKEGFLRDLNDAILDAKPIKPKTAEVTGELPPVDKFQYDYLPLCLRALVQDTAERMSCPPDFPAIVGLVTLAGSVNRRAHVYPKEHDKTWHAALNLWGAIVADPSRLKTPVMQAITRPIEEIEREWIEEYRLSLEDWESRKAAAEKAKQEFEEERPRQRRLHTTDTTIEALQNILASNPEGMLYLRDEMAGWLADMDKKGRESDRKFYLATWSESFYVLDRIGRGSVPAWICLSMFGNFQPGPLAEFLRYGTVDGLFQREQLLVWPDYQPFNNIDRLPNQAAIDSFAKIIRTLVVLPENSIRLDFALDAQKIFNEWFTIHHSKVEVEANRAKAQHMSKYSSLVPQLAALFQLTDCALTLPPGPAQLKIDVDHLQWAINFCNYLESHLDRIYSIAPADPDDQKILLALEKHGALTDGESRRLVFKDNVQKPASWVAARMESLEQRGRVRRCQKELKNKTVDAWELT